MHAVAIAGALVAVVVVVGIVASAVAYARAARHRRLHPPACPGEADDPLPVPALVVVAAQEALATALVLLTAPLATLGGGRPAAGPTLVVVPGALPLWLPLLPLVSALRRDGWVVVRAARPPRDAASRAAVARLGATLDVVRAASGSAPVVVAHGRGGVVARALLDARGADAGVRALVTLGTPHADVGPGPADAADVVAIASVEDALVPPPRAYWRGVPNVQVRGVGHVALLFAPLIHELVREALEGTAPPVAAAARP